MNNGESQSALGGSGLSQTANPQAIPSQNLGAQQNNLQSGDVLKVYNSGIKISGVAGSDSEPVSVLGESTSNVTASTSDQTSNSSAMPLVAGFLIVAIVLAGLILLAVKKSNTKKPAVQPEPVKAKPKSKKSRSKRKSKK